MAGKQKTGEDEGGARRLMLLNGEEVKTNSAKRGGPPFRVVEKILSAMEEERMHGLRSKGATGGVEGNHCARYNKEEVQGHDEEIFEKK